MHLGDADPSGDLCLGQIAGEAEADDLLFTLTGGRERGSQHDAQFDAFVLVEVAEGVAQLAGPVIEERAGQRGGVVGPALHSHGSTRTVG
jgi:hypothetical protein